MKCKCPKKNHYLAITPLPGDMYHHQYNCLKCGSGWGEVVAGKDEVAKDEGDQDKKDE